MIDAKAGQAASALIDATADEAATALARTASGSAHAGTEAPILSDSVVVGVKPAASELGQGSDLPAGAMCFPKSLRILTRRDFLRIQNHGLRIHSKRLVFQFLPGGTGESRLGITVSRKVGNAVLRTQLKRWIREAFRTQPALRPRRVEGQSSYDLVITAKRGVEDFSYAALRAELTQVITRHLRERKQHPPGKRGRAPHGGARGPGGPSGTAGGPGPDAKGGGKPHGGKPQGGHSQGPQRAAQPARDGQRLDVSSPGDGPAPERPPLDPQRGKPGE